jgi:hypothetical protein
VLFGDDHPPVRDNQWPDTIEQMTDRYAAADPERTTRYAPGWLRHDAVLLDSLFPTSNALQ